MGAPQSGGPSGGPGIAAKAAAGGLAMGSLGGGPGGFGSKKKAVPQIEMASCAYPRCDACIFGCPVNAIDMSLAVPGRLTTSTLVVKEACVSCGLCERMCSYDAITFASSVPKSTHVIDMKKCTYPKCTLCADKCPMDSIDFAHNPPVFHHNCEGCDLCFSVCPQDAISVPNLAESQIPLAKAAGGLDSPFVRGLEDYEKIGRFRRLVPLTQVGWGHLNYMNKNAPRIRLNEDDEATFCDKPCKL
jgi:ferredoxin